MNKIANAELILKLLFYFSLTGGCMNASLSHTLTGGCLNASLNHTLNSYPDLILVQIRNKGRLFQGQGNIS